MSLEDLAALVSLVVIELLLSADNSVALAILVKHLGPGLQKKALFYGIGGALAFRALALLAAKWLLESWWLQALGAAYMVYVVLHHFVKGEPEQRHVSTTTKSKGFWRTTLAVELVDAAFAVDSILVAVALSRKLWVIYTAAVLGIVGIRVATTFVIKLLSRFPMLEDAAYFMVGWIGIKLALSSWALFAHSILSWPLGKYEMPHWVFWLGMGLISLWSLFMAWRQKR